MSNASGPIKKITFDNQSIYLTADNETNFYPGGVINTEAQENIGGANPKTEHKTGRITGISSRCALKGSVKLLDELLRKTAYGVNVPCIIELPSGEKWSGSVFAVGDPDSYFANSDAKLTFDLYASEGKFSPVK